MRPALAYCAPGSAASTSSTPPTSTLAGEAEATLGPILKELDRGALVLATKVYFPMGESRNQRGPFAQTHPRPDRPVAETPARRLRRPLPVPSLRRHDAARGNLRDDERPGARRQNSLLGRVGMERRSDRGSGHLMRCAKAGPSRSAISRNTARSGAASKSAFCPTCRRYGLGNVVWSPLSHGDSHRQVHRRTAARPPERAPPASQRT